MEAITTRSMHPLTAIAAVSVTLFSLAGIGAITGLIPTSHGENTEVLQTRAAEDPVKLAAKPQPAGTATASAPKSAAHKIVARRSKTVEQVEQVVRPVEPPLMVAQNDPAPRYEPTPVKPLCHECGVIASVREVEKKGEGTGLGAAVGGVAGGVLGHQTGGGRGKDVMTVLGAIGGAVAGHAIEKNAKMLRSYEIDVRFDDGSSRLITQDNPPAWRAGDKVKLVDGVITANSSY